ncbi:hypothetical protein CsSME_00014489 [Camellia sinensis var. sinensis]
MYVNMSSDDLNFIFSLINATNLHRLEVNIDNFGCKFPEYIGNLSRNLEYLNLDHNHIFGSIPPEIYGILAALTSQLNSDEQSPARKGYNCYSGLKLLRVKRDKLILSEVYKLNRMFCGTPGQFVNESENSMLHMFSPSSNYQVSIETHFMTAAAAMEVKLEPPPEAITSPYQ